MGPACRSLARVNNMKGAPMKRILTIGLACLSLGLAGAASAQTMTTSHSHVAPNGSVHTTTRVRGPGGTAAVRTVDRADGTRTVTRTRTSYDRGRHYGWNRGHHYGWRNNRVCRTVWRHHERIRRCWRR